MEDLWRYLGLILFLGTQTGALIWHLSKISSELASLVKYVKEDQKDRIDRLEEGQDHLREDVGLLRVEVAAVKARITQ